MSRILIVDDDPDVVEIVHYNLENEGYVVAVASDGHEALSMTYRFKPDLILMDIMMPGMDGITVAGELRKQKDLEPVILVFLTARGEDYSQLAAYAVGADDYITKPVKPRILVSKIKALLRRRGAGVVSIPEGGDTGSSTLVIDKEKYRVLSEGKVVKMPRKEFELLLLLSSRPGKVFLREDIYRQVWGSDTVVGERTIDVHIRRLRSRIGEGYIHTVKGVGYKFEYEKER